MATFGTALPMTFFMLALNYTTPANAAILNQFEMVYSLILAYFLLGEKPTGKQIGGSLLIVLGVGVLLWQTGISVQLKGDLLILGTLWMFQVSHIFAKKLPQDMPPALIAAARAIFAIPVLAVFARYCLRCRGRFCSPLLGCCGSRWALAPFAIILSAIPFGIPPYAIWIWARQPPLFCLTR